MNALEIFLFFFALNAQASGEYFESEYECIEALHTATASCVSNIVSL